MNFSANKLGPTARASVDQYTPRIQDSANSGSYPTHPLCLYHPMKNWRFPTPIIIAFILPSFLVDSFLFYRHRDGQPVADCESVSETVTFMVANRNVR